jgi:YidC/Oxa1 family membrane protein insertase
MAGKIFINYRRDDDRSGAARVRDRLADAFGASNIFMDVDNLLAGQRFDQELEKALAQTDVFLAIIGSRWMQLLAERQEANERDYVRDEISAALAKGVLVIPVLLERATLPKQADLPQDMRALLLHQKHDVAHEHFGRDIKALVAAIRAGRKVRARRPLPASWITAAAGVSIAVVAIGLGISLLDSFKASPPLGQDHAVAPSEPASAQASVMSRQVALSASPRIAISTPLLKGSLSLKGARLDDLSVISDAAAGPIELLSPFGSAAPVFAEWGAVSGSRTVAGADAVWSQEGTGALRTDHPVRLSLSDASGLEFRRVIAVDDRYFFTTSDVVTNRSATAVDINPYGRITRYGSPLGGSFRSRGMVAMADGLQHASYDEIDSKKSLQFSGANSWVGMTDSCSAIALIPDEAERIRGSFSSTAARDGRMYQADFLADAVSIPPNETRQLASRIFVGPRRASIVSAYQSTLGLNNLIQLVDWANYILPCRE